MPCCAATFVTIRFHSTLPSHAIRGPYFWMAISNPKRTAALSWLRTVTMRPRSMTETCPLSAYTKHRRSCGQFSRCGARRSGWQGPVAFVGPQGVVARGRPSLCCCHDRAVDRCASRSFPDLHRAAAGFADPHSASRAIVPLPAHRPWRRGPQPMSGDSSEIPLAVSVV